MGSGRSGARGLLILSDTFFVDAFHDWRRFAFVGWARNCCGLSALLLNLVHPYFGCWSVIAAMAAFAFSAQCDAVYGTVLIFGAA